MPRTARWKGVLVLNWWQRRAAAARGIGVIREGNEAPGAASARAFARHWRHTLSHTPGLSLPAVLPSASSGRDTCGRSHGGDVESPFAPCSLLLPRRPRCLPPSDLRNSEKGGVRLRR